MTEHGLQNRIIQYLRRRFGPSTIIWKLNDRITRGIPDLAVLRNSRTTWLEIKMFSSPTPSEKELNKKLEPLQLESVRRAARAARAYYVMGYHEVGQPRLTVVDPDNAREFFRYRFAPTDTLSQDLEMLTHFL